MPRAWASAATRNQITDYTYGLWDQPASLDLPGSTEPVHTFGYDGRGRKIVEDAGNSSLITRYTYDALGRLTKAIYPTGQSAWFFYNKDGQLTEARLYKQDGTLESVTRATYDARGRKTSESWTIGGKTYTLSFGLDPAGNMTSLTYPDGTTVQYVYDEWNRLVAIPGFFGESEFSPGFQYRDTGFLERIIRANGITTTITPDAKMRPVSFQDTALSISYAYDGEGNVLSQNGLAYGYDGLDRLVSAQVPAAGGGVRTVRYAYDKVGNRLTETWDGQAPKAYAYSPGNYLVTAGNAAYSYGSFGELRQKQVTSSVTEYIYDGARRMVGVRAGQAEVARYVYDALGRRISAASGTRTVISLHLGNDIIYETDGTIVTKYIVTGGRYLAKVVTQAQGAAAQQVAAWETSLGGDVIVRPPVVGPPIPVEPPPPEEPPQEPPPGEEPPAEEPPSGEQPPSPYGVFYFHTDLVGSIRAVTDSTGRVVARYEYEPFGLTVKGEGPLLGRDVHKFTGKPEDGETGLYYFGARYYDPELGRFITQDPIKSGSNWYIYCSNSPLSRIDPTGLDDYLYTSSGVLIGVKKYGFFHDLIHGFRDRYLVQHSAGTIAIDGNRYFECNSKETINTEITGPKTGIDLDFEMVEFVLGVKDATDAAVELEYNEKLRYVLRESLPGGKMDQKNHVLKDRKTELYLFHGKLYDWSEAGNVIWGGAMRILGFRLITARSAGHVYTLLSRGQFDEAHDQQAVIAGWRHVQPMMY